MQLSAKRRDIHQVKGSMQGKHMYRLHCDFASCSESTEIRHANSFYVKNCPGPYFFPQARRQGDKFQTHS